MSPKKIKFGISLLLSIIIMMTIAGSSTDGQKSVNLSVGGDLYGRNGDNVSIYINITNADNISKLWFDFLYNETVLNLVDVNPGDVVLSDFTTKIKDGDIRINIGPPDSKHLRISGNGTIAIINFTVVGSNESSSYLNIKSRAVRNKDNQLININIENSTFLVNNTGQERDHGHEHEKEEHEKDHEHENEHEHEEHHEHEHEHEHEKDHEEPTSTATATETVTELPTSTATAIPIPTETIPVIPSPIPTETIPVIPSPIPTKIVGASGGEGFDKSKIIGEPDIFEEEMADLKVGIPTVYSFNKYDFAIYEIMAIDKQNENKVYIRVTKIKNTTKFTNDIPEIVYTNESVTSDTQRLGNILIRLKVNNSWVDNNSINGKDVRLYKLINGSWSLLDTVLKNKDEKYTYFEANDTNINRWQLFAISGAKNSTANNKFVDKESKVESIPSNNVTTVKPRNSILWSGLIIFISGLVVFAYSYYLKVKNRKE